MDQGGRQKKVDPIDWEKKRFRPNIQQDWTRRLENETFDTHFSQGIFLLVILIYQNPQNPQIPTFYKNRKFSEFQISRFPSFPGFFQKTWNFEIFTQEDNNEKDSLREMSITDFVFMPSPPILWDIRPFS